MPRAGRPHHVTHMPSAGVQGVGKQLMRAAMASAIRQWQAQRLYTHVEADNEVRGRTPTCMHACMHVHARAYVHVAWGAVPPCCHIVRVTMCCILKAKIPTQAVIAHSAQPAAPAHAQPTHAHSPRCCPPPPLVCPQVAYRLYLGCGFQEHSAQARYEAASSLGRLLLLQADACDVEGELE
jgi:hypothetical protein